MRKNFFELSKEMGFNSEFQLEQLKVLLNSEYSYPENTVQYDTRGSIQQITKNIKTTLNSEIEKKYLSYENRETFATYGAFVKYLEDNYGENPEGLFLFSEFLIHFLTTKKLYVDQAKKTSPRTGVNTRTTTIYTTGGQYTSSYQEPKLPQNPSQQMASEIIKNIKRFLDLSNHELLKNSDGNYIIVEKNVYASQASQIISGIDINSALKILEYNHFQNKGNIDSKRAILVSLHNFLEPKRKELESIANKEAVSNLFNLFNKLEIRHGKKQLSTNMTDEELESWYDDIYTLILYVILSEETATIVERAKELNKKQE